MRALTILLVAVVLGCRGRPEPASPPEGFEHAYAGPSCAPWDGYAVSLVLRSAALAAGDSAIEAGDAPQLRLSLYPRETRGAGLSGVRPGTVRWPDRPEVASGAWCERGRCTPMPKGRIAVRRADPDGRLVGIVDLQLHGGQLVRGTFDAEWRPRRAFCL